MPKSQSKYECTIFDKPREFVHTGNIALDWLLSDKMEGGGIPIGSIVELAGEARTGKTLVAAKIGAEFQKRGGYVYFNDSECTYDQTKPSNIGLDHTPIKKDGHWYYDQISILEDFGDEIKTFCAYVHEDLGAPDVPICFILDSLGNMRSRSEAAQGMDYEDMGRRAKVTKELMRQSNPILVRNKATLLIVNHGYMNLSPVGARFVTGGGLATDYHTTMRVLLLRTKVYPDDKTPVGVTMKAKILKTKVNYSKENKTCEFDVNWETGPERYSGLLPILVETVPGVEQAGAWYSFNDTKFRSSDFYADPERFLHLFLQSGTERTAESNL